MSEHMTPEQARELLNDWERGDGIIDFDVTRHALETIANMTEQVKYRADDNNPNVYHPHCTRYATEWRPNNE